MDLIEQVTIQPVYTASVIERSDFIVTVSAVNPVQVVGGRKR